MSDFMRTMRPWMLTPRLMRHRTRQPRLLMGLGLYLIWTFTVGMALMMALSMTLAWDGIVLLYGGMFYVVAMLIRKAVKPSTTRTSSPRS